MKKYKILLFDLDDTLVDDEANIRHAIKKLLEEYNYPSEEKNIKEWLDFDKNYWINRGKDSSDTPIELTKKDRKNDLATWVRSRRFLIYFDNNISWDEAVNLNNKYTKYLMENIIPVDYAHEVISKLSKKYKVMIITNSPTDVAIKKIDGIRCSNLIENIYSAEQFGLSKPKIEYMNEVKSNINNFNNDDYLIIGDSLSADIKLGMNSNIDTCWINFNNEELEENYKPTYIVNKLENLLDIL